MEDHVNSRHDLGTDSGITNVGLAEIDLVHHGLEIAPVAGGQVVNDANPLAFTEQPSDEVRSDETGATGHKNAFDASGITDDLAGGGVTPAEKLIPQRLRGRHGRAATSARHCLAPRMGRDPSSVL
jgi:hypothetical protein